MKVSTSSQIRSPHLNYRKKILKRQAMIKLVSFLALIFSVFFLILYVENLLWSSILAFVISYVLAPFVNSLERMGIRRLFATTTLFTLSGALFVGLAFLVAPFFLEQFVTLRTELPKYVSGMSQLLSDAEIRIQEIVGYSYFVDLGGQISEALNPYATGLFEGFPKFFQKFFTLLVLAPFLAFFMVKDGKLFSRSLLAMVPNSIFEPTLNLYHQINEQMGHFIRARLLEAVIVGLVTWLGLFMIDFPFATILALFAAVTNLIPYIGPIFGAIPALVIAVINGGFGADFFMVSFVFFIAQMIDALILIPFLVAKIVNLHPVVVIVAIILGAQLLGVLGMLIAIPAASVIKLTLGTVYRLSTADQG